MDATPLIEIIIKNGSAYAILVGVLYWLFTKYIPAKDAQHAADMGSAHATFRETLTQLVESYERTIGALTIRLDRIEEHIHKKR